MLRWLAKALLRLVKYGLIGLVLLVVALAAPVAYVETACHDTVGNPDHVPLVADLESRRATANTFLTYPEWHIVYAYDGLAEALKTGDEHDFDYASSVAGFWSAACAMTAAADRHGGADQATRIMIHTIGVSFTLEMGLKAVYEETLGHVTAWWRGPEKTPQDLYVADMAVDYAGFLRQTPWYKYDFTSAAATLDSLPVTDWLRGHERRLAIGLEWRAKAAYAGVIADAVAATAPAKLTIRSVMAGLDPAQLGDIPDLTVIAERPEGIEIETPRYARFTDILTELARRGAIIRDIAGNGVIMVSVTVAGGATLPDGKATVLARIARDGFGGDRLLVSVPVADLAAFLTGATAATYSIEHVHDY